MSKSGSHGVDVDTHTEQMRGRGVANGIRADSLYRERWHEGLSFRCGALDQCVDAEARRWLATPVEEHVLVSGTFAHEGAQLAHRRWPQGAFAAFTPLAENVDARLIKMQVADDQLRSLAGTRPCCRGIGAARSPDRLAPFAGSDKPAVRRFPPCRGMVLTLESLSCRVRSEPVHTRRCVRGYVHP